MTYLWELYPGPLSAHLISKLAEAEASPNTQICASIERCKFELFVQVDDGGGVLLTFRRSKGTFPLREMDTLFALAGLNLHSLVLMPAKKSNDPWWVATATSDIKSKS